MSDDDIHTMTVAMYKFGGHFERGLSILIRQADSENRERLLAAFSHKVRQYGPGSNAFIEVQKGSVSV